MTTSFAAWAIKASAGNPAYLNHRTKYTPINLPNFSPGPFPVPRPPYRGSGGNREGYGLPEKSHINKKWEKPGTGAHIQCVAIKSNYSRSRLIATGYFSWRYFFEAS